MSNIIKDSWDKVNPDEATGNRMFNQLLDRVHRSQQNKKRAFDIKITAKRIIPVAACLVFVLAAAIAFPYFTNKTSDSEIIGSIDHSMRGLPVENFNLTDIDNGGVNMSRFVYSSLGTFFEYGADVFAFVRVTDTKQGEDSSASPSRRQTSTIQIIDTLWERTDEQLDAISINQSLYGGCVGDEKTNLLREGGLYLLPLQQSDGNWYVMGDLDVLFEVDEQGRVWSHSQFEDFNCYDGMNVEDFSSELQNIISNEDFMLTHSAFGSTLRSWTLADITISSKSAQTTSKDGYPCFDYTFFVNEIFSTLRDKDTAPLEEIGHITVYADEADTIKLIPGERYLIFLDRYEGEIFINPRMIANIRDDGLIIAIPASDDRSFIGASVFTDYDGYNVNDMQDIVLRINSWREANEK